MLNGMAERAAAVSNPGPLLTASLVPGLQAGASAAPHAAPTITVLNNRTSTENAPGEVRLFFRNESSANAIHIYYR